MKYNSFQWIVLLICICSSLATTTESTTPTTTTTTAATTTTTTESTTPTTTTTTAATTTTTTESTTPTTTTTTAATTTTTTESTTPTTTTTTAATTTTSSESTTTTNAIITVTGTTKTTQTTVSATKPTTQTTVSATKPTSQTTVSAITATKQTTVSATTPTKQTTVSTTTPTKQTTVSTTTPTNVCHTKLCGTLLAECVQIGQKNYTCQCPFGNYYNKLSATCILGKPFPGNIEVNTDYKEEMQNKTSQLYLDLYEDITQFFAAVFKAEDTYKDTVLINVGPSTIMFKHARNGQRVKVDLINIFDESSKINSEDVKSKVNESLQNSTYSAYTVLTICDVFGCDSYTTKCTEDSTTAVCECKDGFSKRSPTDKSCRDCKGCNGPNEMCAHLVNDTFNGPSCLCSPGYKKGDKGCQQCPFGYGGTNCKDNSRLIAVVVGVLAAVIVIGMVGGMIGVTLRSNKPCSGDNEESRLIPKIDKESGPAPGGLSNPVSFPNISFPRPQNICANSSDTVSSQQVTSAPRTGYASYDEDEDPWLEMRKYR